MTVIQTMHLNLSIQKKPYTTTQMPAKTNFHGSEVGNIEDDR
jgi:hypothetical protein